MGTELERKIYPFVNGGEKTLDELTTVKFPMEVNASEAYKVLKLIQRSIGGCRIHGNFSGFYNMSDESEENYHAQISGMISQFYDKVIITAVFSFIRSENKEGNFSGLRFDTSPGYDLSEISEEDINFYDRIQKVVEANFKNLDDLMTDAIII